MFLCFLEFALPFTCGRVNMCSACPTLLYSICNQTSAAKRPHRLVVRTSRCGRDNPGSTPGVVIFPVHQLSQASKQQYSGFFPVDAWAERWRRFHAEARAFLWPPHRYLQQVLLARESVMQADLIMAFAPASLQPARDAWRAASCLRHITRCELWVQHQPSAAGVA